MKDKALFIINSPFQGLCMLEAIRYFDIKDYDVILREDSIEKNNAMLEKLFQDQSIKYHRVKINHIIKDVLLNIRRISTKYTRFFIGDYYSGGICAYSMSLFLAARYAEITYLDDGAQTFRAFSTPPYPRFKSKRLLYLVRAYEFLNFYKRISSNNFFTIFNVSSNKYNVYHNDLSLLKEKLLKGKVEGSFIIGTNSSSLPLNEDYLLLLERVINRLRKESEEITYCPHRRDKNIKKVLDFCRNNDVKIFETEVSVEYDFIERHINPKHVIGFGSSALFSLKALYPDATIENVRVELTDKSHQQRYERNYRKMKEEGINTICI